MRGVISTSDHDTVTSCASRPTPHPSMVGLDLASTSSELTEPTLLPALGEERCRVVALDYGVKGSIYRGAPEPGRLCPRHAWLRERSRRSSPPSPTASSSPTGQATRLPSEMR